MLQAVLGAKDKLPKWNDIKAKLNALIPDKKFLSFGKIESSITSAKDQISSYVKKAGL